MINEMTTYNNEFLIEFENFHGAGWSNPIEKIIRTKILPEKLDRHEIEVTPYYSEREFNIEKDGVAFILHLDDEGSRYILLKSDSTEENKQKLRDWATIIAEEVEKLKK